MGSPENASCLVFVFQSSQLINIPHCKKEFKNKVSVQSVFVYSSRKVKDLIKR